MSQVDVVVVGSGPAGLHAAIELARRNLSCVIVEREREPGGVPLWCHHHTFPCRIKKRLFTGPAYAHCWISEAQRLAIPFRLSTTVTHLDARRPVVKCTSPQGTGNIEARAVLLATGAREAHRHQSLAAGDRTDGVYTTASVFQSIVSGKCKQRTFAVYGAEDVSYSCIRALLRHGAQVAAVLEPSDAARTWGAVRMYFESVRRIPHFYRVRNLAIHGKQTVETISFSAGSVPEQVGCDAVVFTGGFTPNAELVRPLNVEFNFQTRGPSVNQAFQTSTPFLFAAGNCLRGVVSGDEAALEGRLAAAAIASFLEGKQSGVRERRIRLEGPIAQCFPDRVAPNLPQGLGRIAVWPVRHIRTANLRAVAGDDVLWEERVKGLQPGRRIFVPIAALRSADVSEYILRLEPD